MRAKMISTVFLLVFYLTLTVKIFAQTPVPVLTSDLGVPYAMECVRVDGRDAGWPPRVDKVTFKGTCSSSTPCNIGLCGQVCLDAGVNENGGVKCRKYGAKKCTVYDPELDQRYFGEVGSGLPDVTVNTATPHMFPPGQFTMEGAITNPGDHTWYDLYAVSEPNLGSGGAEGDQPSQQLGLTKFVFEGSMEECKSIFWDPYGRVFDAVSLEPLAKDSARVTLLDDKDQYVDVPSNNTPIDSLGKYNIYIEKDGLYKLSVSGLTSHEFVAIDPNPKYVDLYEKIYRKGDPAFIEKQNNPQRYDIPVKPIGAPLKREIETINKDQTIITIGGEEYAKIELRVSHPLTKIETNIEGTPVCEQTKADHTDKEGYCTIIVKTSAIPQEGIEIKKIKNPDYYLSYDQNLIKQFIAGIFSLISTDVSAQQRIRINNPPTATPSPTTTESGSGEITFEPILRYIEGYAHDANGRVIPKAKIQIVLTMNDKVFYSTTADDSGFFTVYKNNLPPLEFYLKIIDPSTSKTIKQTTPEFIKSNKSYIESEKINLMEGTKNNQPIVNPATGKLNQIAKISPTQPPVSKKSAIDMKLLSVFVILFILAAAAVGVVFYIRQSKTTI